MAASSSIPTDICDQCAALQIDDDAVALVLTHDMLRHVFCHLEVATLCKCGKVCKEWRALLEESTHGDPWRAAISNSFPATSGFAVASSCDLRDLAVRMLGRQNKNRVISLGYRDVQFAVTIASVAAETDYTTTPPTHVPKRRVVEYAKTLDVAESTPVSYPLYQENEHGVSVHSGYSDRDTGIQWEVELPLPANYPTEAAPNGEAVLLDAATLVDAMWREADKSDSAPPTDRRTHALNGRYLMLNLMGFRKSDGKVLKLPVASLAMRHRKQRVPYQVSATDALYFSPIVVPRPVLHRNRQRHLGQDNPIPKMLVKYRLMPKLPLPTGPVDKGAKITWYLSMEIARVFDSVWYDEKQFHPFSFAASDHVFRDRRRSLDAWSLADLFDRCVVWD